MAVTMTALTLGVSVIVALRGTGAAVGSRTPTDMLLGEVGIRSTIVLLPFVAGYFVSEPSSCWCVVECGARRTRSALGSVAAALPLLACCRETHLAARRDRAGRPHLLEVGASPVRAQRESATVALAPVMVTQ